MGKYCQDRQPFDEISNSPPRNLPTPASGAHHQNPAVSFSLQNLSVVAVLDHRNGKYNSHRGNFEMTSYVRFAAAGIHDEISEREFSEL